MTIRRKAVEQYFTVVLCLSPQSGAWPELLLFTRRIDDGLLRFPVSLVFSVPVTVIYQSFVGVTYLFALTCFLVSL